MSELPRRSSRRIKEAIAEPDDKHRTSDVEDGDTASEGRPGMALETREGVEKAMKSLSAMELKLQNAVKRQRLALETSDVGMKPEQEYEIAIRQDSKNLVNEILKEKALGDPMDGKRPNGWANANGDGSEHDVSMEDTGDAKLEEEVDTERGARRPPPVNSDQLPLPWKGRLGYVSTPGQHMRCHSPSMA